MISTEARNNPEVVRWSWDGRAFFVDDEEFFIRNVGLLWLCRQNDLIYARQVLPAYAFKCSKMQSFQRNLNIYGFQRITKGSYCGGYFHPRFRKGMDPGLAENIQREDKSELRRKRPFMEVDDDESPHSSYERPESCEWRLAIFNPFPLTCLAVSESSNSFFTSILITN